MHDKWLDKFRYGTKRHTYPILGSSYAFIEIVAVGFPPNFWGLKKANKFMINTN